MFCMCIFLSVCVSASPTWLLLRLCQRFVVYLALRMASVYHAAFRARLTPSKNKVMYSTGTGLQGHGIIPDHHIVSLRFCLFGLSVPLSDKISVTVLVLFSVYCAVGKIVDLLDFQTLNQGGEWNITSQSFGISFVLVSVSCGGNACISNPPISANRMVKFTGAWYIHKTHGNLK